MSRLSALPSRVGNLAPRIARQTDSSGHYTVDAWRGWYQTARWRKLRQEVFLRDLYTCQRTGQLCTGKHPAPNSPVANHKVRHNGNPALFWDIANIETVAKAVHDSMIQAEEAKQRGHQVP